jgi:hypothetical protein
LIAPRTMMIDHQRTERTRDFARDIGCRQQRKDEWTAKEYDFRICM